MSEFGATADDRRRKHVGASAPAPARRESMLCTEAESLEWVLGRLDVAAAARVAAAHAVDPQLTQRTHDLVTTVARLRRLQAPPGSADFQARLLSGVTRRLASRPPRVARLRGLIAVRRAWRVACAAAIVLGLARLGESLQARWLPPLPNMQAQALPRLAVPADVVPRPIDAVEPGEPFVETMPPQRGWARGDEAFFAHLGAVGTDADTVLGWLGARNALEALRVEFRQRFAREECQSLLAAIGAHALRNDRLVVLAGEVAGKVQAALEDLGSEREDPLALALGIRGLLAAGSSRVVGEHHRLVREASDVLLDRLNGATPADVTVSILAAITDVAVVSGGRASDTVRRYAEAIARATADLSGDRRPTLLQWQTRLMSLADAGYVLRLAPAFGASSGLCTRARRLVLAHLQERLDGAIERPEVLAAILCGFGDLVDLAALDARLRLWGVRQLLPDYLALLHYAWGQYPVRRGWANFQDDLRYLSTLPSPDALVDAAALLMTLATNFAAPGSLELIAHR